MAFLKRLLPLLLLAAAACEHEPLRVEPDPRMLIVHGLLLEGATATQIHVARARPGAGGWWESRTVGVSNVSVRLVHGGDTLRLTASAGCVLPDNPAATAEGCYATGHPALRAGARYELLIDAPDAMPVRGVAVIPAAPRVLLPAPGDTVYFSEGYLFRPENLFRVHWSAVDAARRLELAVVTLSSRCWADLTQAQLSAVGSQVLVPTTSDTVSVAIRGLHCTAPRERDYDGTLLVVSYDSVYSEYMARRVAHEEGVREPEAGSGLTGGYGLFAAAAVTRQPLVLQVR